MILKISPKLQSPEETADCGCAPAPCLVWSGSLTPHQWGEQKPALFIFQQQGPNLPLLSFIPCWKTMSFCVLVIVLKILEKKWPYSFKNRQAHQGGMFSLVGKANRTIRRCVIMGHLSPVCESGRRGVRELPGHSPS